MKLIYGEDKAALAAERISDGTDPVHGPTTTFHGVVIASEIIQPYEDGRALKDAKELEDYAWTVEGRWCISKNHPEDAIISDRDQVCGKTSNASYVKNLKDPKTGRPSRKGVRADVTVFNKRIDADLLKEMKEGKKPDVSIGFFYTRDDTKGEVADGPFKGEKYDYVQRRMFHDHLAIGIDKGRCPSPYCGLGADEMAKKVTGDPFAGFPDWEACVKEVGSKNPKLSKGAVEGICGKLKAEHEKKRMKDQEKEQLMGKATETLSEILKEVKALEGERDALKEPKPWWEITDWRQSENRTIFDSLSDETKNLIIDAGLCPLCIDEAAEGIAKDATIEEINKRITELKKKRLDLQDSIRGFTGEKKDLDSLWNELGDTNDELNIYTEARIKRTLKDQIVVQKTLTLPEETGPKFIQSCASAVEKEHPEWTKEQIQVECENRKKAMVAPAVGDKKTQEEKPTSGVGAKRDELDPLAVLKRAQSFLPKS